MGDSMLSKIHVYSLTLERRGWDSNPRKARTFAGFQDQCLQPLGHPSSVISLRNAWSEAVYSLGSTRQAPLVTSDRGSSARPGVDGNLVVHFLRDPLVDDVGKTG